MPPPWQHYQPQCKIATLTCVRYLSLATSLATPPDPATRAPSLDKNRFNRPVLTLKGNGIMVWLSSMQHAYKYSVWGRYARPPSPYFLRFLIMQLPTVYQDVPEKEEHDKRESHSYVSAIPIKRHFSETVTCSITASAARLQKVIVPTHFGLVCPCVSCVMRRYVCHV